MMSNFDLDVRSQGPEHLRMGITLIMDGQCPGHKVTHWLPVELAGVECLSLFWGNAENRDAHLLAYPHDLEATINFVQGWLNQAKFGPRPSLDGSSSKGFRIISQLPHSYSGYLVGIVIPLWAEHHK